MIKIGNTEITDIRLGSTQINEVYLGSTQIYGGSLYELCTYIQVTDSSRAYINTGVSNGSDTEITLDMEITNPAASARLVGNTSGNFELYLSASLYVSTRTNNKATNSTILADTSRHTYKINNTEKKAYVDTTSFAFTKNTATAGTIELFQRSSSSGTHVQAIIYSVQIKNGNTLVRNYVPARNTVTGKYGMLDQVNNVFYASSNSSDFSGG